MNNELFAIKLYEMEKAYGHLQSRIRVCQSADQAKIRQELARLEDECLENEIMLSNTAHCSRTPLASRLAQAQLTCRQSSEACLHAALAQNDDAAEQANAAALYAEYAIDQAVQSMNHALHAVLLALDMQLTAEKESEVPS
ncbi:MAG: hypothetical protein Q4A66_08335 [Eubacteriales bacterium]|nr:hypothetical protein [Eubacteriales bacterium]